MTFDEWWASITEAERKLIGRTTAKYVWLCASDNEREACAKVCDEWVKDHAKADGCTYADCDFVAAATDCAKAIRAMGNI